MTSIEQAARALCEELWSHNIIPIRGQGDLLIANAMFDLTKSLEDEIAMLRRKLSEVGCDRNQLKDVSDSNVKEINRLNRAKDAVAAAELRIVRLVEEASRRENLLAQLKDEIKMLREALQTAISTVECASLDKNGNELPWYRQARKALTKPT